MKKIYSSLIVNGGDLRDTSMIASPSYKLISILFADTGFKSMGFLSLIFYA